MVDDLPSRAESFCERSQAGSGRAMALATLTRYWSSPRWVLGLSSLCVIAYSFAVLLSVARMAISAFAASSVA